MSMLHLHASACKAIPRPLSDLPFLPSRILRIFRGSSLLICSTDRKKDGSRQAAHSVWGQSIQAKELQMSSCTIVSYRKRQKQAVNFYYCSTKDVILIKQRGLLPFYIIPPPSWLEIKSRRHTRTHGCANT